MALYRKYRPATFAEVIGQEHVTEPLSTALDTGRISHAYLFSGPRGCGKTSSARILARSLNCEQGPTSRPCGVCSSCVALAPGGPGNLDVIELDAASHGGVDDTRELRDRAFYAPAESRYRVFIVDEAHMVTTAGFNALLKIVEEPPAHLIFVFATTEPDKVLATIRSRTHHYPFRLLPPATMRGLLGTICEQEGVPVDEAVYPLVIRAGGGSPRDSLSVLDQLLAGAGPEGVTYPRALALLGVTDIALIDDAVNALAEADGAALFGTVDRVVEAGHDPRRFAGDLLERVRDLILLRAVPDAAERNLVTGPGDVLERMREQAQRLGPAALARYAELLHAGLGEMRGATAPRLLLEVVCARMLLPVASEDESATLQRLERVERQLAGGVVAVPGAGAAPRPMAPAQDIASPPERPRPPAAAPESGPPRRRGAEALAAIREGREPEAAVRPVPESASAVREGRQPEGVPHSAPESPSAPAESGKSRPTPESEPGGSARSNAGAVAEQRPHPAQRAQASGPESTLSQPGSGDTAASPGSPTQPAPDRPVSSVSGEAISPAPSRPDANTTVAEPDSRLAATLDQPESAIPADVPPPVPSSASAAAHAPAPAGFAFAPGGPASSEDVASQAISPTEAADFDPAPEAIDGTEPASAPPLPQSVVDSPSGSSTSAPQSRPAAAESPDSGAVVESRSDSSPAVPQAGSGVVVESELGSSAAVTRSGSDAVVEPQTASNPAASQSRANAAADSQTLAAESASADTDFEPGHQGSEPADSSGPEHSAEVSAPSGESAPGAHALSEIEAAWGDIRGKVREFGAAVHALLSGASVARLEGDTVVLAHQHAPLAQRLANPKYVEAVQSAIHAVLGREYGVRWEVGTGAPAARPETPAKPQGAPRNETAPRQAETPRFTRPSQARGGASESGAARPAAGGDSGQAPSRGPVSRATPPEDDIPLPDGPDLPDDPGPGDYPSVGYDGVPPASTPEEEREMLAESATPVPQEDRRDPDEVALELLSSQLGATRLEA